MSTRHTLQALRAVSRVTRTIPSSARAVRVFPSTLAKSINTPSFGVRSFSVSARAFGDAAVDKALVEKLENEIKHEKEAAAAEDAAPEFLTEFKKSGVWTVDERPGHDEVFITRKYGNETIRVMFTISDVDTEPNFDEEDGAEGEADVGSIFPIRLSISVTKPNSGAISIEALAQDGILSIETVSYYKDAKLATDLSAEGDFARRGSYLGPQFEHLDITVQEGFEAWLNERGINEELALFVPEFAEWKEQKEYVSWLNNVKSFVSA